MVRINPAIFEKNKDYLGIGNSPESVIINEAFRMFILKPIEKNGEYIQCSIVNIPEIEKALGYKFKVEELVYIKEMDLVSA